MSLFQPYIDPLPSFDSMSLKISKSPSKDTIFSRTLSIPEPSRFKMPIPANVINIIPKSERGATLRIFKTKINEDRVFSQQNFEPLKMKRDPNRDDIKRKDVLTAINVLISQGQQDYQKRKQSKPVGSMYVNDLWSKSYEVSVRRKAGINREIEKEEDLKRRPLDVKLEEALSYFELNVRRSKTDSVRPSLFSVKHKESLGFPTLTDTGSRTDVGSPDRFQQTFLTEQDQESIFTNDLKHVRSVPNLPLSTNAKPTHKRGLGSIASFSTLNTSKFRSEKTVTESPEKKSAFHLQLEGCQTERSLFHKTRFSEDFSLPNSARPSKFLTPLVSKSPGYSPIAKATKVEAENAINDLLEMCKTEIDKGSEWNNAFREAKKVYRQNVEKRKKRNENEKRDQILRECKLKLEKRTIFRSAEPSRFSGEKLI